MSIAKSEKYRLFLLKPRSYHVFPHHHPRKKPHYSPNNPRNPPKTTTTYPFSGSTLANPDPSEIRLLPFTQISQLTTQSGLYTHMPMRQPNSHLPVRQPNLIAIRSNG